MARSLVVLIVRGMGEGSGLARILARMTASARHYSGKKRPGWESRAHQYTPFRIFPHEMTEQPRNLLSSLPVEVCQSSRSKLGKYHTSC